MKLSLFWKLMLSFALVVAIGLSAVVVLANQVTSSELHQFMMGQNGQGSPMGQGGMMGQGGSDGLAPGRGSAVLQQSVIDRVNQAVLVGGFVALIAALVVGFVVFRSITRPVEQLTVAAQQLSHGNLSARVEERARPLGEDELSELGATFNAMASHLQQAEHLRQDMTADIAHELRTPLAVIRGNLEAMLDGVYPLDTEHLRPALNQVNLLTRLVEDLRTLALAEAGQLTLARRPMDLNTLITNVLTSFEAQASSQLVTLRPALMGGLPSINLDPDRIQQTIAILISNALRYTPPNGTITVSTRRESERVSGEQVSVEVTDTGSGIPAADLPHVFERFYRADKSRSRESGGTGLGLAIARSIVEAHGGSIGVTSQPGRGTTMKVQLPVDHRLT
jgi:signal transduction histidine kinase